MKKNVKVILLVTLIIIITILLALLFIPKSNDSIKEKITTKEDGIKAVENLNKLIIEGGSKKELSKALGTKTLETRSIMTGNNSYLRDVPGDKIIKKYKLEDYIETSKQYINNVEKQIKDNFEVQIHEPIISKKDISIAVTYKAYYYAIYLSDIQDIQSKLLTEAGYNLTNNSAKEDEFSADSYKAKVKAMIILDSHLNNYINPDETKTVGVNYTNGLTSKSSDSLMSYLMNLQGTAYQKNAASQENYKNKDARINQYITEAKNKGIIKSSNPLDL